MKNKTKKKLDELRQAIDDATATRAISNKAVKETE